MELFTSSSPQTIHRKQFIAEGSSPQNQFSASQFAGRFTANNSLQSFYRKGSSPTANLGKQCPYNNFRLLVSGRKRAGDFQASRKIERIAGVIYRETFWKFSGIFEQMLNASRRNKSCD
jgi:hypothetical protein